MSHCVCIKGIGCISDGLVVELEALADALLEAVADLLDVAVMA